MKPWHLSLMIASQLIWGVNFVVVKMGLDHLSPLFFVALRFSLVAVLLLPFVGLPKRRHLRRLLPLSFTMGVMHFTLIFAGMRYLDASVASIAVQLQVPFAAILAAFVFGEKLGWRRLLGMAVAFAGILLIAGEPRFSGQYLPLLAVIGAALAWAVANIQVKALSAAPEGEIHAVTLNGWIAILAAPQLILISYLVEGNRWPELLSLGGEGWFALFYQSIVVAILTYWVWYDMMRRYPVNQVMPFTLLLPVIGVAAGHFLRAETVTPLILAGAALTIGGVGVLILRRPALAAPATKAGI